MLSAFASAFKTPDLRKKLFFTLGMIALYRLGASLPTPNTDTSNINDCLKQVEGGASQSVYSLINLFSGGALLKLSVFALGIMPYITASIIVQLLVVVIPRFEQLKKEGQSGQQKLTQYSRYLTVGLAILQATGFIETTGASFAWQPVSATAGIALSFSALPAVIIVLSLVVFARYRLRREDIDADAR